MFLNVITNSEQHSKLITANSKSCQAHYPKQQAPSLQAHNILWAKALTVGNHQFLWKFSSSTTEKFLEIQGNKLVSS